MRSPAIYCGSTVATSRTTSDDYLFAVATNRNVAIYGNLIIDNSADDYVYAVDATTGAPRGRRRSSTTARTRLTRLPARSSPAAGWSRGAAACRWVVRTPASSRPTTRRRGGAVAPADDPRPRRARRRDVGRRAVRTARARRGVDGAELRSGAGSRLHRNVGHVARPEVPARRHRQHAPVSQLDPRARRRHG